MNYFFNLQLYGPLCGSEIQVLMIKVSLYNDI